ncbi:hypothetical protein AABM38_20555 [Heyndrickxia sp. MSNUG]|uniref:hypothetical protein n=1 Tax=Heyndrickxia sp. MSNUG TaxID=3136677 RepID=UPI003C2C86AB
MTTIKITVEIPVSVIDTLDRMVINFNDSEITRNSVVSYALQMLCVNEFPEIIDEKFKDCY